MKRFITFFMKCMNGHFSVEISFTISEVIELPFNSSVGPLNDFHHRLHLLRILPSVVLKRRLVKQT